jgi:hypothetical protein
VTERLDVGVTPVEVRQPVVVAADDVVELVATRLAAQVADVGRVLAVLRRP